MFQGFLSTKMQCLKTKQNLRLQIEFKPDQEYEIKFRASIIEQHKEIESQIIFAKYFI